MSMDPITQRILAAGCVLSVLSCIAGLVIFGVIHDGAIIPQIVALFQSVIGQALIVAGPLLGILFHAKVTSMAAPSTAPAAPAAPAVPVAQGPAIP